MLENNVQESQDNEAKQIVYLESQDNEAKQIVYLESQGNEAKQIVSLHNTMWVLDVPWM